MATLEKPKQKKSKKTSLSTKTEVKQPKVIEEELLKTEHEHEENLQKEKTEIQSSTSEKSENKIIVDTPHETEASTSTKTSEIQPEISTDITPIPKENEQIKEERTENEVINETTITNKIQELTIAPSAPIFDEIEPIKYPDLPKQETSQIAVHKNPILTLKPFTADQLAQLYTNPELEASREFETCFVQSELRPGALAKHPLYELITKYATAKEKLHNNQLDLERLRKELKSCEESAWIIDNARIFGQAQCQDGVTLYAQHSYQTSKLQQGVIDEINRLQAQIYRLSNDVQLSCAYNCASFRVKVEHYLECSINGTRSELRACLSVLFRFARVTGPVCEEARDWLGGVVAALLPAADWQDHAYVLCHVLRCPPGVSKWAAAYIQVPLPLSNSDPFSDRYINHAVCVLGMLLRGVAARREFLGPSSVSTAENEPWVLVDSDGEEDAEAPFCLRENDLVSLLNQVPIGEIINRTLKLSDNGLNLDEHGLLRLFAFCRVLIDLFNDGLSTFGTGGARYHQFCKRLCRLMGHILRHASDAHELCQINVDSEVRLRLQIELDALFLRCAYYLHNAENLGAWQFLAVLPFHVLSSDAAWSFCQLIHTGQWNEENKFDFETPESKQIFDDRISTLNVEASYYLLNTFANIATSVKSEELAKYVTLRLLDTGFICESTRDSCAKPASALLGSICTKRIHLLSEILHEVGRQLSRIGPLAAQLFRELPLNKWKPNENDLILLSQWLLESAQNSLEHCLARLTLMELNWNELPVNVHDCIALAVVENVEKHGESIWAWNLVYKLRLHATDRSTDARYYPELTQLEVLHRNVRTANFPICNFLTLLMTQHGHLVPMICTHGITQLQILAQAGKFEAVLIALGHILSLFSDCAPDTLANSQSFQGVLQTILNADRTYVKMAKSLVPSYYDPPKNVQLISSVIEHNMLNVNWRNLLVIWMNVLLAQQWNKDQAVLYLLDTVVRISFFDEQAYSEIVNVLKLILEKRCEEFEINGGNSLLSWVGGNSGWPPLLVSQNGAAWGQYAWFSNACLQAEHEIIELRSGLWPELIRQLRNQTGKTNVDACLRKSCQLMKISTFTSTNLCLYRRAQLAIDTNFDHPLLPCLWQSFFHLYLERNMENICVGSKFFDGVVNTTFCKRLKKRLQETAQATTDEKRAKVYRAFSLWLDEPIIQDTNLYLPSLPTQYEPQFLAQIIGGQFRPWKELCDAVSVRDERLKMSTMWETTLNRKEIKQTNIQPATNEPPLVRIQRRLKEHDKPLSPPKIRHNSCPVQNLRITDEKSLSVDIKRNVHQIKLHAELYMLQRNEHVALDKQFRDLLPHLYVNNPSVKTIHKTCGPTCSRRATLTLRYSEAKSNDAIRHQLQTNRTNFNALLSHTTQPAPDIIVASCASIERAATELRNTNSQLAAQLFFMLAEIYGDDLEIYPPARHLFRSCCAQLGTSATQAQSCAKLCRLALTTKCAPVAKMAAEQFRPPHDLNTNDFLLIYGDLVDKLSVEDKLATELLSRLNVAVWLRGNKMPRLSDRSKLISLIFKALMVTKSDLIRAHLINVFTHEFPEHYGEVLQLTLNACVNSDFSLVWRDLIVTLVLPAEIHFNQDNDGPLINEQQLRSSVAQQRMLRQDVLFETCTLLGRYFTEQLLKHGSTFGLYPRYRNCIRELAGLCSLISHALVWAVVCGTGAPADRLVECTYARLVEVHGPWLVPGWPTVNAQVTIQPWLAADSNLAKLMLASLISCVSFMLDAMPASRGALCQTWQLYVNSWAKTGVQEHVLTEVHTALERLPWRRHWPSIQDLESMLRIAVAQLSTSCHQFTNRVLLQVDWQSWLNKLPETSTPRALACILQLLCRLPPAECQESSVEEAVRLFEQAKNWQWRFLSPADFSHACDWCISSLDPRSSLLTDTENFSPVVHRVVLQLLSTIACYGKDITVPIQFKQQVSLKRQCYLRTCVRLLTNCATGRHKQLLQQNTQLLVRTITHHLDIIENLIDDNEQLITELLQLVNCAAINDAATNCIEAWLTQRSPISLILPIIWRTALSSIITSENSGRLLEQSILQYFATAEHKPSWNYVAHEIRQSTTHIEQHLTQNGRLLTLHALSLRKLNTIQSSEGLQQLLEQLVELTGEIRPNDAIESKLPLLWGITLKVAQRAVASNPTLRRWAMQLSNLSESNKPGALRSVFSVITGNSKPQFSPQGRLLCRSLAGYVLAQLPAQGASVRSASQAPFPVGSPGGNTECPKLLLKLEAGLPDDMKHLAEYALQVIQDPSNSMHNALDFLQDMTDKMYSKPYLLKGD